jgi:hypothetical protein
MLITKLQALKLVKEPGMNVDTFSKKVADLVQQIEGNHKRSIPDDLSTIVATCYLDTDVDEFKMEASSIFNMVDQNPRCKSWRSIIQQLKDKYRSLDGLNRWPHKGKKSQADEISALKVTIDTLQQKVNEFQKGGSDGNQDKRECHNCGKKGHIMSNCPDLQGTNNGGTNANSSNGNKSKHWTKIKPAEGESHSKTVNGIEYLWCERCGRWRSGEKKHTTSNHKTRAELQAAAGSSQGSSGGDNQHQARVSGLRMTSSLLTGQIQIMDLYQNDCHETNQDSSLNYKAGC